MFEDFSTTGTGTTNNEPDLEVATPMSIPDVTNRTGPMVTYSTMPRDKAKQAQATLNGLGIENSMLPSETKGPGAVFNGEKQLYDIIINAETAEKDAELIKNALEYLEGDGEMEDTIEQPAVYNESRIMRFDSFVNENGAWTSLLSDLCNSNYRHLDLADEVTESDVEDIIDQYQNKYGTVSPKEESDMTEWLRNKYEMNGNENPGSVDDVAYDAYMNMEKWLRGSMEDYKESDNKEDFLDQDIDDYFEKYEYDGEFISNNRSAILSAIVQLINGDNNESLHESLSGESQETLADIKKVSDSRMPASIICDVLAAAAKIDRKRLDGLMSDLSKEKV